MNNKKLNAFLIYSWFGIMLIFGSYFSILFVGYAILGATLGVYAILLIGIICQIFRFVYLYKSKTLVSKKRLAIESVIVFLAIILTCIFAKATIVYTETGFFIEQEYFFVKLICFAPLYFAGFILQAKTNQRIARVYRHETQQNNQEKSKVEILK